MSIPQHMQLQNCQIIKSMKNRTRTPITVRVFLDGKEINPSSLDKIVISNKTVDRIINDVVERVNPKSEEVAAA